MLPIPHLCSNHFQVKCGNMTKVFISHSTKDRALVESSLLGPLRQAGINWWYSPDNLEGGSEWEREILRGLRSCTHFIIAMTPDSANSPWVRTEVQWAVQHRFDNLLPIMLKPVEPEEFHLRLIGKQYIDLTTDGGKDHLLRLLDANRRNRSGDQESDSTPASEGIFSAPGLNNLFHQTNLDFFDDLFGKPSTPPEAEGRPAMVLDDTIGIEVKDNGISSIMTIFPKGESLPAEHTVEFSTFEDNQVAIDVKPLAVSAALDKEVSPLSGFTEVAEGEAFAPPPASPQFRRLGNFSLDSLLPRPAGEPRIDVNFQLDEFGTLNISAIERDTNRSNSGIFDQVAVTPSSEKVVIDCPHCGASFRVPGNLRVRATCPGCHTRIEVDRGRLV